MKLSSALCYFFRGNNAQKSTKSERSAKYQYFAAIVGNFNEIKIL